ncbi:MAG: hypothetical protein PHR82_00800 [Endomicrobiaceae bacterium]|nr:hypothetical protein [Endomicrobiaceae bacterium]
MKKILVTLLLLFAVQAGYSSVAPVTEIIDTPTHSILDYSGYEMQFRMFAGGGVLSKLNFGIFKSLNLGVGWEISNIIGVGNVVVAPPTLQLKFNIYEGDIKWPGFSIGYDGQGYFYDETSAEFLQKGKGIYIVVGKELFLPSLNFNAGLNINDFKEARVIGFVNSSVVVIEDALMFMLECDNIGKGDMTRLNSGLKLWITETFNIDFAVRNLTSSDESKFGCERIFRINYQGKF